MYIQYRYAHSHIHVHVCISACQGPEDMPLNILHAYVHDYIHLENHVLSELAQRKYIHVYYQELMSGEAAKERPTQYFQEFPDCLIVCLFN